MKSRVGSIFIRKAGFKTTAQFRCEVVLADSFKTLIESKTVQVYCKFNLISRLTSLI